MPTDDNIIPEAEGAPIQGMTFSTAFDEPETPSEEDIPTYSFGASPGSAAEEGNEEEQNTETTEQTQETTTETTEETTTTAETQNTETETKPLELNEESAFKFLKEAKGLNAESLEDLLKPKEEKKLAPIVEKFQEFIEKTGNTDYRDFLETQKDWTQVEPEEALRAMLSAENPELSEKEIDFLYNRKYSIDGLDEEIDEDLILERSINSKTDLKKAHEFLEKRKEEYAVKGGAGDYVPQEYKEAKEFRDNLLKEQEAVENGYKESRNDYVSKMDKYFENFDGIKVKLGNDEAGFEEVSFKPENVEDVKSRYMDVANFNNKFFDENGSLKDPKAWVEALYFAENAQAELNKAYNRGMAKRAELDDKLSKNIQPDNIREVKGGMGPKVTYQVVRD